MTYPTKIWGHIDDHVKTEVCCWWLLQAVGSPIGAGAIELMEPMKIPEQPAAGAKLSLNWHILALHLHSHGVGAMMQTQNPLVYPDFVFLQIAIAWWDRASIGNLDGKITMSMSCNVARLLPPVTGKMTVSRGAANFWFQRWTGFKLWVLFNGCS